MSNLFVLNFFFFKQNFQKSGIVTCCIFVKKVKFKLNKLISRHVAIQSNHSKANTHTHTAYISTPKMTNLKRLFKRICNIYHILVFLFENQSRFHQFLIKSGLLIILSVVLVKLIKKLKRVLDFGKRRLTRNSAKRQSINTKNTLGNDVNNNVLSLPLKKTPALNKKFFKELYYLLRIMFPRLLSKQSILLLLHTLTLIFRTFLSIYVAKLEGLLTKNIVEKNFHSFAWKLMEWLLIALPATTCNSLIRYLESKLDLELKTQLVSKSHKYYFENRSYYRIALKNSETVQIDQNLTEDIDKLTDLLVHLYSHLTKPILDISLISYTLVVFAKAKNFNYQAPSTIALFVISVTGALIRRISPKFGKMAADVAKQKGYLRYL